MKDILLAVSEEQMIKSLYAEFCISHCMQTDTTIGRRFSVKAFSDYIMEYLKDRYNLEDEEA